MRNHIIILEVWYNDPVWGGGKFIKKEGVFLDEETVRRYKLLNPLDSYYYYKESIEKIITVV